MAPDLLNRKPSKLAKLAARFGPCYSAFVMTTGAETLPIEIGQLANFEARMLRNFRAAIDDWDEVCSALGRWEATHLTKDDIAAALAQHHDWLRQLISWGELVLQSTSHPAFQIPLWRRE